MRAGYGGGQTSGKGWGKMGPLHVGLFLQVVSRETGG